MEGTAIILLCSCLLSILMFNSAADTISANQTISDGQTIVSARGEFEMGFFSPKGNPQNRYFGIWYKKIANGTIIWVANRESPIANTSGLIRVSSRGIILSTNRSTNIEIWSSDYSESVKNPVAQLLDTGNLVFRDENELNFAWQSVDHLVDNVLPGMKFGYDLATGADRYTLPWKNEYDPAPGNYTHRVDKNGYPQIFLWKDSVPWYRTGPWIGSRFSGIPVLKPNGIYTSRFIITETEVYFVFDLVNSSESSPITRMTLNPAGTSTTYIWNREKNEWTQYLILPVSDCDRYGICGTNGVCNVNKSPRCECMEGFDPKNPEDWAQADWTNGCSRKVQLECGNGDGFLKCAGVKLPDTRWSWYDMNMNLVECKKKCLKDCNCTAYSNTDIRNGGSGCLLWFGGLKDIKGYSEDGQDLYVRMAASELKENRKLGVKKHLQLKIVLVPVLVILTVMISLYLLYAYKTKRRKRAEKEKTLGGQDLDLPLFSFMQIAKATDNFSDNRQLGKGGFGTVYKGILEEGQEVAVKRLSKDSRQGVDEFMNEVSCIAKLQHRNLVMLLGCCIEEGERLLIYEYLPNKSLDYYIFDKNMCRSLNWPKRYNIILGTARGLLYLHQDSRLKIIHRDLKASNILLDHEMNPKISDFGLARTFGESETPSSTTRVVGTHGYMSPEYAFDGLFSVKSDVYSFGVSVLEIIAGKRNRGFDHPDHNLNLIGHVWKMFNECNLLEVVDTVILESCNQHKVFRVIQIGLLCVQEYPDDRPNMSATIMMLTRDDTLPIPKQPGFFVERKKRHETGSSSEAFSLNTVDISSFAPR
ncbi:G-type lectin S-receptor-like serine/threonine-protein kinase [Heracleum sosnowskyi]|uniref:Receptor-like serine/threonine-protein kinase n=1 Tax=Heracleum sosnowskyi TaxID=360622 RepID=A0AAD8IWM4_9APIA|nr:G-type lectin S-receptor-like serine/threonine-protein kinase [Heracleum sosnowskyi]